MLEGHMHRKLGRCVSPMTREAWCRWYCVCDTSSLTQLSACNHRSPVLSLDGSHAHQSLRLAVCMLSIWLASIRLLQRQPLM